MFQRSIGCGIAWMCALTVSGVGVAQKPAPANSLTIYNQDFALVRTPVELDLKAGTSQVSATNVTAQVEPDSVVLRDPAGKQTIHILEQNYDGALRVQAQMLAKFEGKTIDFLVPGPNGEQKIVPGKIVRAGSVPQYDLIDRYGQNYFFQVNQPQLQTEPLIETEGKLRYGLPGTPLFSAQSDGITLKPTLRWLIESEKALKMPAELDYMTKGLRWDATYNVIASTDEAAVTPKPGQQRLEMVGWVNVTNESGTDFHGVSLQLMAGDISKLIGPNGMYAAGMGQMAMSDEAVSLNGMGEQSQITHKSFDEYQLYDLHRTTDLLDHQNKQIEFLNAMDIPAERVYVYDGFKIDNNPQFGMRYLQLNQENFGGGVSTNKKVWAMQEFKNSEANHLGMPLPKGRMRFYRRDSNGSLEFIGENQIDHTPKNETLRIFLGDAFDLTGDRVRMDFKTNNSGRRIEETYKITLKNEKSNAVKVRVVEHLYRTANWAISNNSDEFAKKDSQTMEFNVDVPADGEKQVTYTVTYTW